VDDLSRSSDETKAIAKSKQKREEVFFRPGRHCVLGDILPTLKGRGFLANLVKILERELNSELWELS